MIISCASWAFEIDQAGGGAVLSAGIRFSPLRRFTSRATVDPAVNSPRSEIVSTGQESGSICSRRGTLKCQLGRTVTCRKPWNPG